MEAKLAIIQNKINVSRDFFCLVNRSFLKDIITSTCYRNLQRFDIAGKLFSISAFSTSRIEFFSSGKRVTGGRNA